MAEVIPHIVVRDAGRAAEWYERTLGAEIGDRIPVPDGRFMQIELRFGNSLVVIADEFPRVRGRLAAHARWHIRRTHHHD